MVDFSKKSIKKDVDLLLTPPRFRWIITVTSEEMTFYEGVDSHRSLPRTKVGAGMTA